MKNAKAIQTFMALGEELCLHFYRLIIQKGDDGLMPSKILEMRGMLNANLLKL